MDSIKSLLGSAWWFLSASVSGGKEDSDIDTDDSSDYDSDEEAQWDDTEEHGIVLVNLPNELLVDNLLPFLDDETIRNLAQTCKKMRRCMPSCQRMRVKNVMELLIRDRSSLQDFVTEIVGDRTVDSNLRQNVSTRLNYNILDGPLLSTDVVFLIVNLTMMHNIKWCPLGSIRVLLMRDTKVVATQPLFELTNNNFSLEKSAEFDMTQHEICRKARKGDYYRFQVNSRNLDILCLQAVVWLRVR